MPGDLEEGGGGDNGKASPTGKCAAELEKELAEAHKKIAKHNGERALFGIILIILWDSHTFKSYSDWAPVISLLALEFVGLFVMAYILELHVVISLFWAAIRAYGKQDPGDTP